ncbi:MAG TPA: hypothetical protein VJQ59_07050 [Candidatus Sulfotelmatobacter sp.]|nr:hypothetical protein [Candidatus Sulfotelmatobacter sp.]
MIKQTLALVSALFVFFAALALHASEQPTAETIIRNSLKANAVDWKAMPDYDCFERDQQPDGSTKTYEDLMILGSPYERLVAINGKSLSGSENAQEKQKLQAEVAKRRHESPEQRQERISNYEKARNRDNQMMDQLTKAFNFTLLGQQKLGPFDVYVLKATPRPGYRPPNMDTQALKGMQGKLWIDKNTFQWVKVEAHVIHPVSIEGFLAEVEPGTRFELDKGPGADGMWFPTHYAMKARAKILFFIPHKSYDDETYYDYHKAPEIGPE